MKAILLADGERSPALYPLTVRIPKELLAVYNKPLIYYPISNLMLAGIRDLLIVGRLRTLAHLRGSLGDGSQWGIRLQYAPTARHSGMLGALLAGRAFCDGQPVAVVRSDTVMYGRDVVDLLQEFAAAQHGAAMFAYSVRERGGYSLVALDPEDRPLSINNPNPPEGMLYAVPDLFFYDQHGAALARNIARRLGKAATIDDLNRVYMEESTLRVVILGRGVAWLDASTPEALLQCANFIQVIEERQGFMIACPEEIAYRQGFIIRPALLDLAGRCASGPYREYLLRVADEHGQA